MWKEFKPTILFLVWFVVIYLGGNLIYGWWVTSYAPHPDPATVLATKSSAWVLDALGWSTTVENHSYKATTLISTGGKAIVSVYEGCNGLNVVIVFLSFLLAFGPRNKRLLVMIAIGLAVIYVTNVARIVVLFIVAIKLPGYYYLTHKYLFTAFIYLVVFLLWIWWIKSFSRPKHEAR